MKKRILLLAAALACLTLLAGCKILARTDVTFDLDGLAKAQKIVIYDAGGNEKDVLTGKAEIEGFVDAMGLGDWTYEKLPEGLTCAGAFTLWQEGTVTALFGEREAKVNEICTFRIYQEEDYLTIETGLVDVAFAVSRETADYLRDLAA